MSTSRVILHVTEMTRQYMKMMQANLVTVSLITNINKSLKTLLGANLTQKFCTIHTRFYYWIR